METTRAVPALAALANETRLDIFRLLVRIGPEGLSAGRLADHFSLPPATLSFHLSQLSRCGLVQSRRESRHIIYSAGYQTINSLIEFLMKNCCKGPIDSL